MTERRKGHAWQPIADLPEALRAFQAPELDGLVRMFAAKRADLAAGNALQAYVARLVRSWSIETGILENLYTLSSGVTTTLVEQGFDSALISHGDSNLPAGQLIQILEAHREAAEGLFAFVRGGRSLNTSHIKELHAALTRHQTTSDAIDSLGRWVQVPLRRGDWKIQPNNPANRVTGEVRHEYCPPEQVASEMDRLVAMHQEHRSVHYVCEAAWLHHRFTQVHPFQDGNGRVARALASLVAIRAGGLPIAVKREQKADYLRALEAADQHDLKPLTAMFVRQQREALLRGAEEAQATLDHSDLDVVLAGIRTRLDAEASADPVLEQLMDELVGVGTEVMRDMALAVERALSPLVTVAVRVPAVLANGNYAEHSVGMTLVGRSRCQIAVRMRMLRGRPVSLGIAEVSGAGGETSSEHSEPPPDDVSFTFTAERQRAELIRSFTEWLRSRVTSELEVWRRRH
jgi:prophage maintenance system killer protein